MLFHGPYLPSQSPHSAVIEALRVLMQATTSGARREAMLRLASTFKNHPQVHQPLTHHFLPGLYQRERFNFGGSLIITKRHKAPNFSHVMRGRLLVISEEGHREIVAPASFATPAGTWRVIVALEDSVFTTTHPNPDDCTDPDVLEERFAEFDEEELP